MEFPDFVFKIKFAFFLRVSSLQVISTKQFIKYNFPNLKKNIYQPLKWLVGVGRGTVSYCSSSSEGIQQNLRTSKKTVYLTKFQLPRFHLPKFYYKNIHLTKFK